MTLNVTTLNCIGLKLLFRMRWGDIFFKTPGSVGLGTEIKWRKCLPLPPPRRAVHNSRATSNKVCIGGGRGRSLFVCFAHHILMLNTTRVMATYLGMGGLTKVATLPWSPGVGSLFEWADCEAKGRRCGDSFIKRHLSETLGLCLINGICWAALSWAWIMLIVLILTPKYHNLWSTHKVTEYIN